MKNVIAKQNAGLEFMRVLIGTPIHESKDYCMERWIENVAKIQKSYPADLLLVDNSAGLEYVKKVKEYCKKYSVKNYTIDHIEFDEKGIDGHKSRSQKIEIAQETIRRKTLKEKYDAWFSWECDQIIPLNTLNKLTKIMQKGNYMMVVTNSWARTIPGELNTNMGVTLISKTALKKAWFLPDKNGQISLDLSDVYSVDETMFKKRILKSGGNYIEIYGVIEPIYHLDH